MPLQFGPRLTAFLDEPLPITIGTTRKDGSVQMNPSGTSTVTVKSGSTGDQTEVGSSTWSGTRASPCF